MEFKSKKVKRFLEDFGGGWNLLEALSLAILGGSLYSKGVLMMNINVMLKMQLTLGPTLLRCDPILP